MISKVKKLLDDHEPHKQIDIHKVEDMLQDVDRLSRHFKYPGKDEIYDKAKQELINFFPKVKAFKSKRYSF